MSEVLTAKINDGQVPTISHMMIIPNEPAVQEYLKSSYQFGPIRKLSIGGKIEIDLETCKVTLTDCDLDEASRLFWDAINIAIPLNTRPPEPMNILYEGQMMTKSTFDLIRKSEKNAAIPKDSGQV